MKNKKKDLLMMAMINIPVVVLYYFLYKIEGIRPYANIAYFCVMLAVGYFPGKAFLAADHEKGKDKKTIYIGIFLMFFLYFAMRVSYLVIPSVPRLRGVVDLSLWRYFVQPWHDINIFMSVAGVIVIVFAVEMFYRVYVQNTLNAYFSVNNAIFFASVISGVRAAFLNPVSGLVDFSLALIWGWVYARSGFWPAVATHMVWDVCFVYFPAR